MCVGSGSVSCHGSEGGVWQNYSLIILVLLVLFGIGIGNACNLVASICFWGTKVPRFTPLVFQIVFNKINSLIRGNI